MTTTQPIKGLFANDITRRIEEVIKVDQTSEDVIRDEIDEYVVTDAIRSHYTHIYDAYSETPNKPHEGIAIWVSGFFGSGKSSFAKMLGLSIGNRTIGTTAAGGMLVGTVVGVLVIPGLYYLFGKLADGRKLLQDEVNEPLSEIFEHTADPILLTPATPTASGLTQNHPQEGGA